MNRVVQRRPWPVLMMATLIGVGSMALTPHRAAAPAGQVLVVGDSAPAAVAAYRDLGDLQARLAGWRVTFDTDPNRSIPSALQVVRAAPVARFGVVIVAVGENDSPAIFAAGMRSIMSALAAVPKVYWLTVREAPGHPSFPQINTLIRQVAVSYPNLAVADWNAFGAGRPADFARDGLHLTSAGGADMAAFLADLVNRTQAASPSATATTAPAVAPAPPADATSTPPATAAATTRSSRGTSGTRRSWETGLVVTVAILAAAGLVAGARARHRRRIRRSLHAREVRANIAMIAYHATHHGPEDAPAPARNANDAAMSSR